MNWDHLVGIPYIEGGDGPGGFDCLGLVRYAIKEIYGLALPESAIGWRRCLDIIPWPTEIEQYDILCFSRNVFDAVTHVGVAISQEDFLHANRLAGQVVLERLARYRHKIKAVGRRK